MREAQKPTELTPQEILGGMATGYLLSRALHVVADLGIADLLSDGPKPVTEDSNHDFEQTQTWQSGTRGIGDRPWLYGHEPVLWSGG